MDSHRIPGHIADVKIALVGNPNCGKTTLFNALTGSRAKVANLPGVTVAEQMAMIPGTDIELIDTPGAHSLHPKAIDEMVTRDVLLNNAHVQRPDAILLVLDAANLKRNLYLAFQVRDLERPTLVVVNETQTTSWNAAALEAALGLPLMRVNALKGNGLELLKAALSEPMAVGVPGDPTPRQEDPALVDAFPNLSCFGRSLLVSATDLPDWLTEGAPRQALMSARAQRAGSPAAYQLKEAGLRSHAVREAAARIFEEGPTLDPPVSRAIDRVLTHRIFGPLILFAVFFFVFQSVYAWSGAPMDWIDQGMGAIADWTERLLPAGWGSRLLVEGIIPGLGGVVIFVPQIAILFGAVTALEESGYMTRVSFMNDRWLRALGLDGRSTVPLMGGFACSIPAIIAVRAIPGRRQRLLTILITPWMTCSARLPVYVFLVGFVVPDGHWFGLNLQGLFLFGVYAAGLIAGLTLALLLHRVLPKGIPGSFTQEWPPYRWPSLRNIGRQIVGRSKDFITSAGHVIIGVSIVLWVLSNTAPSGAFTAVDANFDLAAEGSLQHRAARSEASWAGELGRFIEPAIAPLGYDGRMGIALIASFAAREVFVGTMAVVYAAEEDEVGIGALQNRLAQSGTLSPATALSLIVFYMFAMQCASTIAVVRRELDSWWWAIGQALGMTAIAWIAAFAAFNLAS